MISTSSVLITVLCYTGLTLAAYGSSSSSTRSTSKTATTSLKPNPLWGQCGGFGWTGSTECAEGTTCIYYNVWFSQCLDTSTTTTGTTTTSSTKPYSSSSSRSTSKTSTTSSTTTTKPYYSSSSRPTSTSSTTSKKPPSPLWGKCGGLDWTGSTECAEGTCVYANPYNSQCLPNTTTNTVTGTGTTTTTTIRYP